MERKQQQQPREPETFKTFRAAKYSMKRYAVDWEKKERETEQAWAQHRRAQAEQQD